MVRLLALLALLAPHALRAEDRFVLDVKDARRVTAELTFDVTCLKLRAKTWVVFAAVAPELPGQVDVKSRMSYKATRVKDLNGLPRSILVAQVPATKATQSHLPIRVTYEATLRSRRLRSLLPDEKSPSVEGLTAAERKAALGALGDIDHNSAALRKWMSAQDLLRKDGESDLVFARRVFLALRSGFTYEFKGTMNRRASAVCAAGKSDCGGLANLFVAVLRANKVPARSLWGRWAYSTKTGEKLGGIEYHQWHVKAELFADGVGWVPVDLSSGILYDRSRAGLRHFGRDDGNFLTLHIDPDLSMNTVYFGVKSLENLQTPAFWVHGSGNVEPTATKENWQVK